MSSQAVESGHDPLTHLTHKERELIRWLEANCTREEVLRDLKKNLQVAVEVELATIPIYLYTYYSIQRNERSGRQMRLCDLFANKAGGMIMSVAVEEMLHMTLAANVLYALGGKPQIYGKAPCSYPTGLPYHKPKGPAGPHGHKNVLIPLAKLGYDQLWHFLQIEYPEAVDAKPQDRNWETIGQLYSYVRCQICTTHVRDEDFQVGKRAHQVQSFNYSPNNVDTIHPRGEFDPWDFPDQADSAAKAAVYSNEPDSHAGPTELVTVDSKRRALIAIDTICDQGEGYAKPGGGPEPTDDPSKSELSHYYKFLTIQAQFEDYKHRQEQLPDLPKPPQPKEPTATVGELAKVVHNFPDNPTTAGYPKDLQPLSDFCNGVFQYMLILTETLYKVPPDKQKLFFNEGLHRSMIWILDKYIGMMRGIELGDGHVLAPTFENIDLGLPKTAFACLCHLGEEAKRASKGKSYHSDVVYYVAAATTGVMPDGSTVAHLPDVNPYW